MQIPLKRFLTLETCPPGWPRYDLYVIRDDAVAFYVGQSYNAFDRVWTHIRGGPRGRSTVGRFVLCNWPASMRFTIELLCSASERFAGVGHDLDAAERLLIEELAPCFNDVLNRQPTPLPACYLPPDAKIRQLKSYSRMLKEAAYAVRQESRRAGTREDAEER